MYARVSNIEAYRQWRLTDDEPEALVQRLTAFEPTEAMLAGTAFHKALELAQAGTFERMEALGYTFLFPEDCEIAVPAVRELRCNAQYGPLTVSGRVDALFGLRVEDHKSTAHFGAERYLDGCQWRFYLDIFGADVFRWNVFEIAPVKGEDKTYRVAPPQILEACRYAGLHDDCMRLALGFHKFASIHLKETA